MRRLILAVLFGGIILTSCSDDIAREERDDVSVDWELVILDSIQVDYLGVARGGEFRNGKGVFFDFERNSLVEFDETGRILNKQEYPKEGPGAVSYPTTQRYSKEGTLYAKSFLNMIYELNADLTLNRAIEFPFMSASRDGSSFLRTIDIHNDNVILWYPGRDGADPYDPHFFKDNLLLEKINLNTGESEPIIEIAPSSRYSTDKYWERPWLSFGVNQDFLFLNLSNEPKVFVYDLANGNEFLHTIDFEPSKFMDNGEHSEPYQYVSGETMKDGRIKGFYTLDDGLAIFYSEGISGEIFQQNELGNPENFGKYPLFERRMLKVWTKDSVLTNEMEVPGKVDAILNIESLTKPFYALRDDDFIGEEHDFITFYKMKIQPK